VKVCYLTGDLIKPQLFLTCRGRNGFRGIEIFKNSKQPVPARGSIVMLSEKPSPYFTFEEVPDETFFGYLRLLVKIRLKLFFPQL
jgi:hypothetical protein